MSRLPLILAGAVVLLVGCSGPRPRHHVEVSPEGWLQPRAAGKLTDTSGIEAQFRVDSIPARLPARPWAGTVSHHLLAAHLIDFWYSSLAQYGPYNTIIILSPKHTAQGAQEISVSDRDWEESGDVVQTDARLARRLARSLGVPMDHGAFYNEHGIGAQIPFIRKYFPKSRIVPILLEEAQRRSDLLVLLSEQILPILRQRRDVLVILSTDFSHHADRAKIDRCDSRTFQFFRDVSVDAAPLAGCDSRAGILVLSLLAEGLQRRNALILAYTDSGKISSVHEDMTSYFFTFLY